MSNENIMSRFEDELVKVKRIYALYSKDAEETDKQVQAVRDGAMHLSKAEYDNLLHRQGRSHEMVDYYKGEIDRIQACMQPYTTEILDDSLDDDTKDSIEHAAQEIVNITCRSITSESSLRALAAEWSAQAEVSKHSTEMLCRGFDSTLSPKHDAYYPLRRAWINYKIFSRAVKLLGIPDTKDDELQKLPGETAFEYIKRTEYLR